MKRLSTALPLIFLLSSSALAAPVTLETDEQKFSYGIGMQVGKNMKQMGVTVDLELFKQAVADMLADRKALLSEEELQTVMQVMHKKSQEKEQQQAIDNLASSRAWLAENAKKDGVKVTDSGLQYRVIKTSEGAKPKEEDNVVVHYRGTLTDGTEFDSSYARNTPATFPVNAVIKGWQEGLPLMTVGSKYEFFIPPELAYAERGAGQKIGPNAVLLFEVELLEIKEAE